MHYPDSEHCATRTEPTGSGGGYASYVERILDCRSQLQSDFDVDAMLIVMGSVRLGHLLSTSSDTTVHRPAGSTFSRFRVLFALWMLGPQPATELARMFDVTQPTVTGLIDGLETAGLVTRETDPNDRRSRLITTTNRGAQLTRESMIAQDRHEQELLRHLTSSERQQLAALLSKALAGHAATKPR